ncbi:hypothetical protein BH24ACT3_BH24ACT3_17560 [soil metagenome]
MQPSTDQPTGSDKGRALRRYGPLVAIVAILAIVAGTLVVTGGGDDDGDEQDSGEVAQVGDFPEGAITFDQAEADDLDVEFKDTCDPETGQAAIPYFFAAVCFADVDDNGGATAPGVTADAIKVVVYLALDDDPILGLFTGAVGVEDTGDQARATYEGYVDLFQTYYQTYGREVQVEFLRATGNALDEVAARADAARAAEMEHFAVWGGPVLTTAWTDEITAREIICLGCLGGGLADWYEERAPYAYPITSIADQDQVHLVEYLENRVAGRPAVHAGDEAFHDQERVLGVINLELTDESVTLAERFEDQLAEAGVDLGLRIPYTFDPGRLQEQADGIIARMKEAGVTNVVMLNGDPITPANLTRAATAQDFFPEWIVGGTLVDTTVFARTYDQEQWAHAFGPSGLFARIDPTQQFSWFLYRWFTGEDPPAENINALLFPQPALFFSGIQAAGPDLSPETFRDGLFALEPTPNVVTNPSISFGDKGIWPYTDYAGIDDHTEIWWDPDATGPDEIRQDGQGLYQYVEGGRRYLPGEWTDEESKVCDPEGAVAVYDEPPEDERPPDYPSPAE